MSRCGPIPIVTRFIGGKPRTREESWIRFLRHAGMWQHMGFGFWAIEEKATGRFIGEAGFHELRRDMEPSIEGTLEAGWGFVTDAHGKGYATEAVPPLLAWGEANHRARRHLHHRSGPCRFDPRRQKAWLSRTRHAPSINDEPMIIFDRQLEIDRLTPSAAWSS